MSMVAQWSEGYGMVPGLRDALRSLSFGAAAPALTAAVGAGALGVDASGGEAADAGLWRLQDREVTDALAVVGQIRQLLEVAEVDLVREGLARGLPAESAWSAHDWVTRAEGERSPDPSVRHVGSVVRVAQAGTTMAGRYWTRADGAVGELREAFTRGDLPLGKADQLARFHAQVAPVADEEELADDLSALVAAAQDDIVATGPDGRRRERVRGLTDKELAAGITRAGRLLRPEKDQDREDKRAKAARTFTKSPGPAGMSAYKVVLDAEGAAVIDSAIAALSGPVKGPEGEHDERPATQRRADALVEIIRRGVSAPGEAAKSEKAQLMVTIGLDDLRSGTNGAGVTTTGEVLAPATVRKLACDAGIIPVILGSDGEVLDLGRTARFFTPGQRKAIWLRDRGCTYPGCTMPPQWCDAHHVAWWSRGGATDTGNAALLCERHHTKVHTHDLTATITPTGVTWHV
ncbi:HNH endonuclease signature motif containing protein [Janibacter cremeus]|uniref:HNH nuclease domain-containing protein n=1 Tax=Janibacter cremeus TaxID=1285192 RepID=A0A852VQR5_9MICO|nr:HNH endonuclease signature motif containing protein [Janibacter cremeus]NYF98128.1 hypothetical protein [Janibacter cremeus]